MAWSDKQHARSPDTQAAADSTIPEGRELHGGRERLLAALMIDAIGHRQQLGAITTLRDLHTLLDVPQPVALRVAYQLKHDGTALIDANVTDAFASEIRLHAGMQGRIDPTRNRPDLAED
ncbi:MAG: hypothetical protein WBA51_04845 [Erythrobacter sp.]